MEFIKSISVFNDYTSEEKLAVCPEEYIKHSTKDDTLTVGLIKTETLTLYVVKKDSQNSDKHLYEIYDLSGKKIIITNSKSKNYTAKFYVINNKEVVVDFAGKLLIKSNYELANTDFKENVLGIPRLFLYNNSLYYYETVIEKYSTQIYQVDIHRYYRVCYNVEKCIIFTHTSHINSGCFPHVQQINIDQNLGYLIKDNINNKEKFIELIKLSFTQHFEKLEDVLKYIKYMNRLEVIDKEKNEVIISIITALLTSSKLIEKSKIMLLADKFV